MNTKSRVRVFMGGEEVTEKSIGSDESIEIRMEIKKESRRIHRGIKEKYKPKPEPPGPVKKVLLQEGIGIYGFVKYPNLKPAERILWVLNNFQGYDKFYTISEISYFLNSTWMEIKSLIDEIEEKLNSHDGRILVLKNKKDNQVVYKINHHIKITLEELIKIWKS